MERLVNVGKKNRVARVADDDRRVERYTLLGVVTLLCYLVLVGSCTNGKEEEYGPVINDPFPVQHTFPVWAQEEAIYVVNDGAIEGGGGTIVDEELRGIIRLDVLTRDYRIVVLDGGYPARSSQSNVFSAILEGGDGPIVVGTDSSYSEIEEYETWTRRNNLTISHTGRLLAWANRGPEHSIGIWIMEVDNMNYRYLGLGDYCKWNPTTEKLAYRVSGTHTCLVEYEYSTGEYDTLISFPPERAGRYFGYAPDGEDIAYFCHSLDEDSTGVYVWDRESGLERQLGHHVGYGLDWGSGGIIYANSCGDEDDAGCGVIWLLDSDSGESRQLTERFEFTKGRRY